MTRCHVPSSPKDGGQSSDSNQSKHSEDWLWPALNLLINVLVGLGKSNPSQHIADHGSPVINEQSVPICNSTLLIGCTQTQGFRQTSGSKEGAELSTYQLKAGITRTAEVQSFSNNTDVYLLLISSGAAP